MSEKYAERGRRERKRLERRDRVLAAARSLFRERGFTGTVMADIADRADVGVGTVYNYYPSKDLLLVAVLKSDLKAQFPDLESDAPPFSGGDPVEYVMAPALAFLSLAAGFDKALWYPFLSAIYHARWQLDDPVFELDRLLMTQTARRLARLREMGVLQPDVDPRQASVVVFGAVWIRFQMAVMDQNGTLGAAADRVREDARLLMKGLAVGGNRGGAS